MARLAQRLGVVALAAIASVGLASCGGGADPEALAACATVHRALVYYDESVHAPTAARRAALLARATREVAGAQSDAAMATASNGIYAALMTTLQQAQELPFSDVASALRHSCAAINSPTNGL